MQNNAHSGRLDGSNTLLQQRSDGIVFYLALNRTDHGDPDFAEVLGKAINTLLNGGGYSWPGSETSDGFWVSLGAENSTAGFGGYHSSYQGFQTSLDRVSDGSYLRLRAGRQDWKGRIQKRLRLDAPEGAVILGL